ncbi:MAG: 3'-5' exonuclease [Eubacterium sp.]|nr:3'-5' exonuclease [Eubacterium sp.]
MIGSVSIDTLINRVKGMVEMTIVIDTETTGLVPANDELLQVSIIDTDGNVLFDSYFKPSHTASWEDAMEVNHITPEMVKNSPAISDKIDEINRIVGLADRIIGYNTSFDLQFLSASGLNTLSDDITIIDAMAEFAPIYGDWNDYYESFQWQSLATAADFFGYDWSNGPADAHNSLADCYATLYVYDKIKNYNNSQMIHKLPPDLANKFLLSLETTILTDDWRGFPKTVAHRTSIKEYFAEGKGWIDNQKYVDTVKGLSSTQLQEFDNSITMVHARCIDYRGQIHNIDMITSDYKLLVKKTYDPINKDDYCRCLEANKKLKAMQESDKEHIFFCAECLTDENGNDAYYILRMDSTGVIEVVNGDVKKDDVKPLLIQLYKENEGTCKVEINRPSEFRDTFEQIKNANQVLMRNYGYENEEMLPILNDAAALKAFDNNMPVYLLYTDNTESLAQNRNDIQNFEGIFGIVIGEFTLSSLSKLRKIQDALEAAPAIHDEPIFPVPDCGRK